MTSAEQIIPSVEYRRLTEARVGHLATVTSDGHPHVVPFCFGFDDRRIISAVDAKPKSTNELRRLANIDANPRVSFVVDHYDEDWTQLWWVRIDGTARVVRSGAEHARMIDVLVEKYDQYKQARPPGAVVVIEPTLCRSWGC